MVVSPHPSPALKIAPITMTLNLKVTAIATSPEATTECAVVSLVMERTGVMVTPVPTLATTLEVVSPMILNLKNLKGKKMPTHATTLEGAGKVVSPVPTLAPTPEVLSPITLNL